MDAELVPVPQTGNLQISEAPGAVLEQATNAAKSLQTVIRGKKKPVIFNGEQYLEFEDWQTCARFYGLAAKVVSTSYVEYGESKGFEAKAEVIRTSDGMVISSADSMCLNDEPNWSRKPLFQLKSMAQTRACAKALRNVLAWVVVLAGYRPTPAEEVQDMASEPKGIVTEQVVVKSEAKEKTVDLPDDQLGNWKLPFGKYKGLTLSHIASQYTSNGQAQGMNYLEWVVSTTQNQQWKEIITRFLEQTNKEQVIQVDEL